MLKLVLLPFFLGSVCCSPELQEEVAQVPKEQVGAVSAWIPADGDISWKNWEMDAFREARERDCPVLLYQAAPGCEGVFATGRPAVRTLLEEHFVAIRVDPFRRPDIARRYAAGGWPSVAVLLPDGRAFTMAVDLAPENVELFLWRMLTNYEKQRAAIERTLRQAEKERLAAAMFEVEVDRVYRAIAEDFDPLHGGFGRHFKFPESTVLRFLLEYYEQSGDEGALKMVTRSLEALLHSPMHDRKEGGFHAFSHSSDWRTPALEKDALDQAGLMLVLLQAAGHGRGDEYAVAAEGLVGYIATQLFDEQRGSFSGRQVAVQSAAAAPVWWTDPVAYADRNALLVSACVAAAVHLQDERAERMARAGGDFLLRHCVDAAGGVYHVCAGGVREVSGLLEDQALVGAALLDLYELSGEQRFREWALKAVKFMEEHTFDTAQGAFFDRSERAEIEVQPHRRWWPYKDGLLPAGNALAAEIYVRLGALDRALALLAGKRLGRAPGRPHSALARTVLLCEKMRDQSL